MHVSALISRIGRTHSLSELPNRYTARTYHITPCSGADHYSPLVFVHPTDSCVVGVMLYWYVVQPEEAWFAPPPAPVSDLKRQATQWNVNQVLVFIQNMV